MLTLPLLLFMVALVVFVFAAIPRFYNQSLVPIGAALCVAAVVVGAFV